MNSTRQQQRLNILSFLGPKILSLLDGNGNPLQYSCLENPMGRGAWWAAVHGVAKSQTRLSDFIFTFHFHALEKEMAAHCSVLAWRIPGMAEPGGLPSMGSHRVGHAWSDLAVAAAYFPYNETLNLSAWKLLPESECSLFDIILTCVCQCHYFIDNVGFSGSSNSSKSCSIGAGEAKWVNWSIKP